jgi:hypothetical protein
MKKFMIFALSALFSIGCFSQKPLLHYDFKKTDGKTVKNKYESHYDGTLKGSASIKEVDGKKYAYLGYEQGYIDMGAEIGESLKDMNEFTVAVKYLVEKNASLNGNGYFLWAFSTLEQNTQDKGLYHAYKLNVQRGENSIGGWSRETILEIGKPSEKGEWQYVVYTQKGKEGRLFLNGRLVAYNNEMYTMESTFSGKIPMFNWIGRAPFKGDAYLAGTWIGDVRVYNQALSDKGVRKLTSKVMGK